MGSRPRCTAFDTAQPMGPVATPAAVSASGGSQYPLFMPLPAPSLADRRVPGISAPDLMVILQILPSRDQRWAPVAAGTIPRR